MIVKKEKACGIAVLLRLNRDCKAIAAELAKLNVPFLLHKQQKPDDTIK